MEPARQVTDFKQELKDPDFWGPMTELDPAEVITVIRSMYYTVSRAQANDDPMIAVSTRSLAILLALAVMAVHADE